MARLVAAGRASSSNSPGLASEAVASPKAVQIYRTILQINVGVSESAEGHPWHRRASDAPARSTGSSTKRESTFIRGVATSMSSPPGTPVGCTDASPCHCSEGGT
mmetsp:Transcript_104251/g.334403  ORF Transcript_104251/g.334403 Transcript_104251/m.334403 type:complete len:105 (+) Transcript_104251:353-667(+)